MIPSIVRTSLKSGHLCGPHIRENELTGRYESGSTWANMATIAPQHNAHKVTIKSVRQANIHNRTDRHPRIFVRPRSLSRHHESLLVAEATEKLKFNSRRDESIYYSRNCFSFFFPFLKVFPPFFFFSFFWREITKKSNKKPQVFVEKQTTRSMY